MKVNRRIYFILLFSLFLSSVTPIYGHANMTSTVEGTIQVLPMMGSLAFKFASGFATFAGFLIPLYIFLKYLEDDIRRGAADTRNGFNEILGENIGNSTEEGVSRGEAFIKRTRDGLFAKTNEFLGENIGDSTEEDSRFDAFIKKNRDELVAKFNELLGENIGNSTEEGVSRGEAFIKRTRDGLFAKTNEFLGENIGESRNEEDSRFDAFIKKNRDELVAKFNELLDENIGNSTEEGVSRGEAFIKRTRDGLFAKTNEFLGENIGDSTEEDVSRGEAFIKRTRDGLFAKTDEFLDKNVGKSDNENQGRLEAVTERLLDQNIGKPEDEEEDSRFGAFVKQMTGDIIDTASNKLVSYKNQNNLKKGMAIVRDELDDFVEKTSDKVASDMERGKINVIDSITNNSGVSKVINGGSYGLNLPGRVIDGIRERLPFGSKKKRKEVAKKKNIKEFDLLAGLPDPEKRRRKRRKKKKEEILEIPVPQNLQEKKKKLLEQNK